jgi:N-acetylneuraminic acid mutarotase
MVANRFLVGVFSFVLYSILGNAAFGHFLWLVPQDESGSTVQLYFSEGPQPDNPKLLQKLSGVKVQAFRGDKESQTESLAFSDDQKFLSATSKSATAWRLNHTYGLQGTEKKKLLIYTALSVTCERVGMDDRDSVHMETEGFVVRPTFDGQKLEIALQKNGQPVKGFEIELYSYEGHRTLKTDDSGTASADTLVPGVYAVRCLETDETPGQLDGVDYQAVTHYTTASFIVPNLKVASLVPEEKESLGALPEAITSFGATHYKDAIYAYGGNTGGAHSYSNEQQFNKLVRLDLKNNKGWETIAEGARVQGNALVSYGNSVILVGGFTATNAKGEKGNLVSQSNVQQYDLAAGKWSDLPSLPEPRSSMDAIVLNGYLYAIGGWNMKGNSEETEWHKTAWRLPLENTKKGWEPIAAPPFQRRAVAVAAHKDRVFVIGGMNENAETTTETCIYDPKSNSWTTVAPIAGVPLTGFGTAAAEVGDQLVVCTVDGAIQRFNDNKHGWEIIGQIPTGRFFHRIVPISEKAFAIIGGANMSVGKFRDTPVVRMINQ